jgi:hypothetical protein
LSTTNSTWIDPGAKPGFCGEKPVTNDLSHGTALNTGINIVRNYKVKMDIIYKKEAKNQIQLPSKIAFRYGLGTGLD